MKKSGFFTRLGTAYKILTARAITPETFARLGILFGQPTSSGMSISPENALTIAAAFACIRVISEDIGKLPLITYSPASPRGKERAKSHPAYKLLLRKPNDEQSAQTVKELISNWALSHGNGYAEIERLGSGTPKALWPIHPRRVTPRRNAQTKRIEYSVDGKVTVPAHDMLHIKGVGDDGIQGYSIIHLARESLGAAMAADQFAARYWGNGSKHSGVLEHPGELGTEALKNLRDSFEMQYAGVANAHKLMVLEEGMKFKETSIPPEDAQFLQTRLFDVEQIARWYRVPPHKIGHLAKATNNNIEQQALEYVGDCLLPWCVRWESEIDLKLFDTDSMVGDPEYFAQFYLDAILRADMLSRFRAYAIGRQWGWLNADDVCELENRNPLPDSQGSHYLVPVNMVDASSLDELVYEGDTEKPKDTLEQGGPDPTQSDPGTDNTDRERFLPLVDAALRRLRKVEFDKLKRGKISDPAEFYRAHSERVAQLYTPIARAIAPSSYSAALGQLVERHIRDGLEMMQAKKTLSESGIKNQASEYLQLLTGAKQ